MLSALSIWLQMNHNFVYSHNSVNEQADHVRINLTYNFFRYQLLV